MDDEAIKRAALQMRAGIKNLRKPDSETPTPSTSRERDAHVSYWKFCVPVPYRGRTCILRVIHLEHTSEHTRLGNNRGAYPSEVTLLLVDVSCAHATRIGDITYDRLTEPGESLAFLPEQPKDTARYREARGGIINVVLRALLGTGPRATDFVKPTTRFGHDEFAAFMTITPKEGYAIAAALDTARAALCATTDEVPQDTLWGFIFERDTAQAADLVFDFEEE